MTQEHADELQNLVRQYTYPEYYSTRALAFRDPPKQLRIHVGKVIQPQSSPTPSLTQHNLDHCIDMLRQKIMCDGDVGAITFNWLSDRDTPSPDFSTWHKCRNFDGIMEWALTNGLPEGPALKKPAGVVGLRTPI